MASPHVAAVAALVLAEDSALDVASLKSVLLDGVDTIAALTGITVTGGRLNAANSLAGLNRVVVTPVDSTLAAGTTAQFNATGGTAPYTWSISDNTIASIDVNTGILSALAEGQATVTAMDANGVVGNSNLTVTTVLVSPDTASLRITDTQQFNVTGGTAPYTWDVSDATLASIDSNTGLLTAIAIGTLQVTATDANGISDNSGDITISDIAITPNTALMTVSDTLQFSATGGTPPYSWSNSNLSVATIDANGVLTAIGAGITTVTVTDSVGISVTSGSIEVREITVNPQTANVVIGNTQQFTATGGNAPYNWTVSDSSVANIDSASGLLTGITIGTVVVTAIDADGIIGSSGVITVSNNHIINVTPYTATVSRFGTLQFTASGGPEPYTWSLSNPSAGIINAATGLFQAGRFPTTTTVIATDADGHVGESGTITVTRQRR